MRAGRAVILGAIGAATLATPASADVLVHAPDSHISCGGHIKTGVWYQSFSGGPRDATIQILVGGRTVIQVVQPDGTHLHAVTSPPGGSDSYGDARPAWSSTGSQIAFTRGDGGDPRNGTGGVYVVSARGGTPRRVGPGTAPVFSPHGRYLAYADRFDGSMRPRALHIADLRKPSRRVALPGGLATFGFLDQLTWLP
jgi:WD40 repeat protein